MMLEKRYQQIHMEHFPSGLLRHSRSMEEEALYQRNLGFRDSRGTRLECLLMSAYIISLNADVQQFLKLAVQKLSKSSNPSRLLQQEWLDLFLISHAR